MTYKWNLPIPDASMEKCNKKLAFFLVFGNMSSLSFKHYDKTSFNSALIQRKYYSWLFYFTSLQKQQKQKVTKKVVKKKFVKKILINFMEKMVVREGEPEPEESKNEDNIDLNELNEQIRQAVEDVDEEDLDEDYDEEGELWESHD